LSDAERFYVGVLGFDLMQRYGPSALFVSAGGYHHHVGLNTWAGVGAPPPPPGALGLRHYVVTLPDEAALPLSPRAYGRRTCRLNRSTAGCSSTTPRRTRFCLPSAEAPLRTPGRVQAAAIR
jgi:catechol 2,3-dioxygenase